jgi:hypothetical protein
LPFCLRQRINSASEDYDILGFHPDTAWQNTPEDIRIVMAYDTAATSGGGFR